MIVRSCRDERAAPFLGERPPLTVARPAGVAPVSSASTRHASSGAERARCGLTVGAVPSADVRSFALWEGSISAIESILVITERHSCPTR